MKSTLLLVCLLTIGTVFGDKPEKICNNPADIVFVLDESGSIWNPHFTQQLNFVQSTIETFDVGFNRTHIGVLTFGTNNRIIFPLGKYTEEQDLKNAVKEIVQHRGETYTHLALKRLREEMFSQQYSRPWVDHVSIVITDGESNEPAETEREAHLCHKEKIRMFAIGVGIAVSRKELEAIASSPDLVFTVEDYAALESLRQILAGKACESPTTLPPPASHMKEACVGMDNIWSISDQAGVEATNLALEFIKDVTKNLTIAPLKVQVGLAPRFCDEGNGIRLKDHDTRDGFWRALDKHRLTGLRTDRTIEYIHQQGFSPSNGGRPDVVKYGILIIDDQSENWEKTLREAQLAKNENVRLIVIGVGDKIQQDQLRELASSNEDYFFVENYSKLADRKTDILQRICQEKSDRFLKLREFLEQNYD